MPASTDSTDSNDDRDVLRVDRGDLRDTISVTIDRELIDELDRRRQSVSRSEYLEMVLTAALAREHPHLPDGWTPGVAAQQRYARAQRYLQTGR